MYKSTFTVKNNCSDTMNTKKIIENLNKMKKHFPDLLIKKIKVSIFKHVYIITTDSVSSGDKVNDFILKYWANKNLLNKTFSNIEKEINNFLPAINMKKVTKEKDVLYYVYNGFTVVLSDYEKEGFAFETRAEIDRGVTESSSEPNIKGPKDSFTENYQKNIGLIRKRIKSENLFLDEFTIGKESKTRVGLFYMNNICEDSLVIEVKQKLRKINIDGVLDNGYLKELFKKENHSIFPTILSTEKPDNASKNLLDGKVVIVMENSPNVLLIPTLLIDFIKNQEDYNQKAFFSTFIRIIRTIAFVLAIIMPGFYIAITTCDQEIIPTSLLINFATQREGVPFPAIIEALILLISFEILNEGDSRVPSARTTSLSILGALILGEAAVSAGIISPIMVIVIAITSICSLLFSYLDIQAAIRFWRYILMFFASFFGIIGLFIGILFMLINLCSIKSFGKPYLMPFSPIYKDSWKNAILRFSLSNIDKRDKYLARKNIIRRKG